MKIIKRNGTEVEFDKNKIISAITKANGSVSEADRIEASSVISHFSLKIPQTVE